MSDNAKMQVLLKKLLVLQYSTAGHGKTTSIIKTIQDFAGLHFQAHKRPAHIVITAFTNNNVNEFEFELSACYKDPMKPFTFEVITLDSFCNRVIGLSDGAVSFDDSTSEELAKLFSAKLSSKDELCDFFTHRASPGVNTLGARVKQLISDAVGQEHAKSAGHAVEPELGRRLNHGRQIDLFILDECQDAKDVPRLILMMLFLCGKISHVMLFGDYMQRIYDSSIHILNNEPGIKCFQVDSQQFLEQVESLLKRCSITVDPRAVDTRQLEYKLNSWRLPHGYVEEVNKKLPGAGTFGQSVIDNFAKIQGMGTAPEGAEQAFTVLAPEQADQALGDPACELIMGDVNLLSPNHRANFPADTLQRYTARNPSSRGVVAVYCELYYQTLNEVMNLLTNPGKHLVRDYQQGKGNKLKLEDALQSSFGDRLILEWVKEKSGSLLNWLLDAYVYAPPNVDKQKRKAHQATAFMVLIKLYYGLLMTGLQNESPTTFDLSALLALKNKDFNPERLRADEAMILAARTGECRSSFVLSGILGLLNKILQVVQPDREPMLIELAGVLNDYRISTLRQMLDVLEMRFGHKIILDICKTLDIPVDFILYTTTYKMKGGTIASKYIYFNGQKNVFERKDKKVIGNQQHTIDSLKFVGLTRSKRGGYVINQAGAK